MFKRILRSFLLLAFFASVCKAVTAQNDPISRIWLSQDKTAKIEIYPVSGGKYCGKVVWLMKPTLNGKVKMDMKNPDKQKRNMPLLGLEVLKGFVKSHEGLYEEGTIYDPINGKTYSCKMTIKGNKLEVRGYYGISFIGRTAIWTKAE